MELLEIELSLNSNILSSKYRLKIEIYTVKKHTLKTFFILKNKQEHRLQLSELLVIKEWSNNTNIENLRYKIWAFKEDFDKAVEILQEAFDKKINELNKIFNNSIVAVANGYVVQKINHG